MYDSSDELNEMVVRTISISLRCYEDTLLVSTMLESASLPCCGPSMKTEPEVSHGLPTQCHSCSLNVSDSVRKTAEGVGLCPRFPHSYT